MPVGPDFRADAAAMADAIDDDTVLVVASAPSYAHGVVDPVTEIAAAAAARGVRCHVDACIGGWVLPYAARLGRPVPPWTFAVEGVTSISVDTHKYAYAPKGTSLLLHRDAALRKPQFFASAAWPGYTMLNATTQSTRSGGPVAGTWAVVEHIGDDGYLALAERALAAVDAIVACIEGEPALRLVVAPDSTLVTLATDASCDPFTLTDELVARGWYVQPQLSFGGRRAEHPPVGERRHARARRGVRLGALRLRGGGAGGRPGGRRPRRGRRSSRRSTRPRSATTTSTACSPHRGWWASRPTASSSCRAGWRRSTRCSTSRRRRCARRCWWRSSTGSSDPSAGTWMTPDERARRAGREGAGGPRLGRGAGAGRRADRGDGSLPARGGRRRPRLPARGRPGLPGVPAPARRRTRPGRGAGPLPQPRPPDRAELRRRAARLAAAAEPAQHLRRAARRPRHRAAARTATCRRGPTRA